MDGGLTEGEPPSKTPIGDMLDRAFPYYLQAGISPKDYWDGDPAYLKAYLESYKIRQEQENHRLWLQGAYVYEAICCCAPILNAFSKERKPRPYPEKPWGSQETTSKEGTHSSQQEDEKELAKIAQYMQAWASDWNKQFLREQARKEKKTEQKEGV